MTYHGVIFFENALKLGVCQRLFVADACVTVHECFVGGELRLLLSAHKVAERLLFVLALR